MRLRRQAHGEHGETVAVQSPEGWVPIAGAVERLGDDPAARALTAAADDLVGLLADGEASRERLRALLARVADERWPDAPVLPLLRPASLRCFSGWQAHWEQAARVMARRYHPAGRAAGALIAGYEALTRRTFPPLRPAPEFFAHPIYYTGNHLTVIHHGQTARWPGYCADLDFELELGALVIRPLLDADEDAAWAAVGGVLVANDWSARDTQWREHTGGAFGPVIKTKSFATSLAAELVTPDELTPDLAGLAATVHVGGQEWSRTSTDGLRWSVAEMVAWAARGEQVHPGELMLTGTLPRGAGMELDRWLAPGDEITLDVDLVGTLTSTVGRRGAPPVPDAVPARPAKRPGEAARRCGPAMRPGDAARRCGPVKADR